MTTTPTTGRSSTTPSEAVSGATNGPPELERSRRRFLRRRRQVRWHLVRRALAVLALVGLTAGGVWLLFFSSAMAVDDVEVRGTSVVLDAAVVRAAEVPLGEPLATVDLDAVRARVEGLLPVASAEVSRGWPDTVVVTVTEREAVASVAWEGQWRGVDAAGLLFRTYDARPPDLPVIRMRAATTIEAMSEAAAVVQSLPEELLARVASVDVDSIDSVTLQLRSGAVVRWGSAEQSEAKVEVLEVLLDRKARVYDVTAPGRPTIAGAQQPSS